MECLSVAMRGRLKSLFNKNFDQWKAIFEDLITLYDPDLWIFITEPYELPIVAENEFFPETPTCVKMENQMSETEKKMLDLEKKTFETILACLPDVVASHYKLQPTSFRLWDSLKFGYGSDTSFSMLSFEEGMKEELKKKEEDIKALQTQVLNMENEREELCVKVARMEQGFLEFESQQKVFNRLQEDHELAVKTIQDLHERLSHKSYSEKVVKKIYKSKSLCEKKFSQFTNYSLQKNKKCSEKIQSTKPRNHQKVDCRDNSGHFKWKKSSVTKPQKTTTLFKPTHQPKSKQTKSYAYTRDQMFAFAPPRFHHMVQNRRKDFVPFSWRPSVRQNDFKNERRCLNHRWNSMSLDLIDKSYQKVSEISRKITTVLKWVPKVVV